MILSGCPASTISLNAFNDFCTTNSIFVIWIGMSKYQKEINKKSLFAAAHLNKIWLDYHTIVFLLICVPQIGLFLKYRGDKFCNKSSSNVTFWLIWKMSLEIIAAFTTVWTTFGKCWTILLSNIPRPLSHLFHLFKHTLQI